MNMKEQLVFFYKSIILLIIFLIKILIFISFTLFSPYDILHISVLHEYEGAVCVNRTDIQFLYVETLFSMKISCFM